MNQYGLRGDFKGFTFNNIHSSTLGIARGGDGSRYNDGVVAIFQDTAIDVMGGTGKKYFGSAYSKRDISVSFAFDNLTEIKLRRIRQLWNDKQIHDLIFDEAPYKVYSARVTGNSVMKFVAFDDGVTHYRGEGNLTFTCYFPYARSRYEYDELYTVDNIHEWVSDDEFYILLQDAGFNIDEVTTGSAVYYDFDIDTVSGSAIGPVESFQWVSPQVLLQTITNDDWDETMNSSLVLSSLKDSPYINKNQWLAASRIPKRAQYGIYNDANKTIQFYNAGDIIMPTRWWYRISYTAQNITISAATHKLVLNNIQQLHGTSPTGAGADEYIVVDMPNGHIEGYDQYNRRTGRMYDKFMDVTSEFFGLPLGDSTVISTVKPYKVEANYLYL